jgi:protease-4
MDGAGTLNLLGYSYGRGYFRQTLDKLGIGVRELRYLEYKSAMETYTRVSLSEADKLQYDAYLDTVFSLTRNTLMQARSLGENDFDAILDREFIFSPRSALDRGLVDCLGREDALRRTIEELEGKRVTRFAVFGNSASSLLAPRRGRSYTASRPYIGMPRPEIAVINASGETDLDRGMKARLLSGVIREISEKSAVKAMVIRIDSPGGSAEAADYIAEAIREAKKRIPVVVSMGSVAASGGYWAGMYADHIVASPYTLSGSIGVIGSWFYDTGLYGKLGVSVDTLRRGAHADLTTGFIIPRRDLTADEEERFRHYIMDLYGEFVEKVAAGRKMNVEVVEPLARGRVYSGVEAQRLGLVDSIGGLPDALAMARKLAKLSEKRKIVYQEYPKPTVVDNLLAQVFSSAGINGAAVFGRTVLGGDIPGETFFPGVQVFSDTAGSLGAPSLRNAAALWADIRYRLSRNGSVMPILPLFFVESSF